MTAMMMEASSPLAAMQPPSYLGHYGYRQHQSSYGPFSSHTFGPNRFNFKDLSMKSSQLDYFNMPPPVRGSSPTASLAADLSQNFHIDQSPQLPTPRRSLFSTNIVALRAQTTTPPIPTSSPGPCGDSMDMSPLPHKQPYGNNYTIQLQSPSPESTPIEASMSSLPSPDSLSLQPEECITLQLPQERRRLTQLRPSLSRAKSYSMASVPQRPAPESQLPPFRFGSGISRPASTSSLSLSQIFEESPVQERSLSRLSGPVLPPTRVRPGFLGSSAKLGSPCNHVRKNSNPLVRPRKQFRRSLSMFEHPDDIMKQDKDAISISPLPLIKDVEVPYQPQLPHFTSDNQTCDLPRISRQTMIDVLDGKFNHMYSKRVVIDCRFEYEYKGGHIDGAVNFNDKEQLASQLFDLEPTSRALLIFHCEYSAHRAPLMAKFIRNKDRTVNAECYPALTYPEAYILDGGYSAFYKDHSERCFPRNYVEMDAKEHERACEKGLGKVKQRSKLIRAQTFAFGDHSPGFDSSPTTMCRRSRDDDVDMDMGCDFTPIQARPSFSALRPMQFAGKRMLSY